MGLLARARAGKTEAIKSIGSIVSHQGGLSPAPALACAPYLLEALEAAEAKPAAALLVLLANLAMAGDHEQFLGEDMAPASSVHQWLRTPEIAAVRDRIVSDLRPEGWLGHKDPEVRSAAALCTAVLGARPQALADQLSKEAALATRCDLLIALGWSCRAHVAPLPALVLRYVRKGPAAVRCAAAVAVMQAGTVDAASVRALYGGLSLPTITGSAWAQGQLALVAAEALRHRAERDERPQLLLDALAHGSSEADESRLAASLVKTYFCEEYASFEKAPQSQANLPEPLVTTLSQRQRDFLDLLSQSDRGWCYYCDQRYYLEKLGLPQCPPQMREYLHGTKVPGNACDLPVTLADHQGPIYRLLPKICTKDSLEPAIAAGRALALVIDAKRAAELVEYAQLVATESHVARTAFCLHYLVAAGEAALEAIATRLARFDAEGIPCHWLYGVRGGRAPKSCGSVEHRDLPFWLCAAGRAVDPTLPVPKILRSELLQSSLTFARTTAAKLDPQSAGWVVSLLDALR
jgi:hypothetical protein